MSGKHPATQSHNHIAQMIALLQCLSTMELEPGELSFYVEHRGWCGIFKNKFCNCDPVVSLVPPGFHRIRNAILRRANELKVKS